MSRRLKELIEIDIKKSLGAKLKERRQELGMTQKQVADVLGVAQPVYQRFEKGTFECSYSQLTELCKLFDISADYLLGLKDY